MIWLQKNDTVTAETNMTTNAIFNEVIEENSRKEQLKNAQSKSILKYQFSLPGSKKYSNSFYLKNAGHLWVEDPKTFNVYKIDLSYLSE